MDSFIRYSVGVLLFFLVGGLSAQEILTASDLFERVSQRHASINDYTADIEVYTGDRTQRGLLAFLQPEYLRITFSSPPGQEIVINGEKLLTYIPQSNFVLEQKYGKGGGSSFLGITTPEGLRLIQEKFSMAYISGAEPQALPEIPGIRVYALRLTWKNKTDGLRQLNLYVGEDLIIRRVEATTANYKEITLIYNNISINNNLTKAYFDYEPPGNASVSENFLFE